MRWAPAATRISWCGPAPAPSRSRRRARSKSCRPSRRRARSPARSSRWMTPWDICPRSTCPISLSATCCTAIRCRSGKRGTPRRPTTCRCGFAAAVERSWRSRGWNRGSSGPSRSSPGRQRRSRPAVFEREADVRRAFGLADWPADVRGPVLALGTFDGIHLGHRRVLGLAVDRARARGGPSAALTFERHPLEVLRPAHEPVLLSTVDERLEQFEALGIDVGLVLPFDDAFSKIAAAVPVHLVPAVLAGGEPVSSSRIRAALREGLVEDAARLLGRCYRLAGRIVPGAGRGRTIGVPTANLATPPRKIVPAHGVYATVASVRGRRYRGATNIGTRPTFGGAGVTVETFLLDFEGDCTGDEMVLEFVRYLRGERAFPDAGALTRQIAQDVAAVRELPGEEEAGIM